MLKVYIGIPNGGPIPENRGIGFGGLGLPEPTSRSRIGIRHKLGRKSGPEILQFFLVLATWEVFCLRKGLVASSSGRL